MVDVGAKGVTLRTATAEARVMMQLATANAVRNNEFVKGDVLQVARLAGIGAAKRSDELIPLCHGIPLDSVAVTFEWFDPTCLIIRSIARATAKTGVEMEALVAASMAALTVYDMCKAMDRSMEVTQVRLLEKSGGMRGDYRRET